MATQPKAKLEPRRWDSAAHLETDADIVLDREVCLEEAEEDAAFITAALPTIAKVHGMTVRARDTGLTREGSTRRSRPMATPCSPP